MTMCMCEDLYCQWCGPAQGNCRCPICGRWSDEGGCDDPTKCEEECKKVDEASGDFIDDLDEL